MKKIVFNNIEENKLVMGYVHYRNNKNRIVYKKAVGYIVPEECMVFCISSHNLREKKLENMLYEKTDANENLYSSILNAEVFELKQYIYPKSDRKISSEELEELVPLLEKYIIDEDFEPSQKLQKEYHNDMGKKTKTEIKSLMLSKVTSNR